MNPARMPLLAIDFDGVLHGYQSGWQGADQCPDQPVPGAMQAIRSYSERFRIAVHSSRSSQVGGIAAMQAWLRVHLAEEIGASEAERVFAMVEWPMVKPPAMVTIDDRAVQFTGEWPSVGSLANFQPWNKRSSFDEHEIVRALSDAIDAMWDGGWDHDEELRESRGVIACLARRGLKIVRV